MGMVYFIAKDGKNIVTMDSETSITVSKINTVVKNSVMSGRTIGDDLSEGNPIITVSGLVTYSKTNRQTAKGNPSPLELSAYLDESAAAGDRFILYTGGGTQKLLSNYDNCVIASHNLVVDKYEDTVTVSLVFEQVFVSAAAKTTYLPPLPAKEVKGKLADTKSTGSTGKTQVEEEVSRTFFNAGAWHTSQAIKGFFGMGEEK